MASALTAFRNIPRALPVLAVVTMYAALAAGAFAQGTVATDRAALEALYDATGGGNWSDNANWKTNAPLDDWYGVSTDSDGRVITVDLRSKRLAGPLPAALGDLSRLERLFLEANLLTGSIPAALGNLSNLENLYLFDNSLSGSIPAAIGNLSKLEELALNENALAGPIPESLGNLSSIYWLDLSENALTGPVPAALGNLSNLEALYLDSNGLSGPLPSELTRLSRLLSLRTGDSGLCAPADGAFQAWLAMLTTFSGSTCTTTGNRPPEVLNPTGRGVTLTAGGGDSDSVLAGLFSDPDNDSLTYTTSSSDTQVVTASITGNNTTLTIVPGQAGTATLTVTAQDPGGLTATHTIRVTVDTQPTGNRAPLVLNPNREATLDAGSSLSLSLAGLFRDPDNDALTYSPSSSNPRIVTASITNNNSTLRLVSRQAGTATVAVTAQDPDGLTATQTIPVTVNTRPAENRSPEALDTIPPQSIDEGGRTVPVSLLKYFRDPDNDRLTFTAESSDAQIVTVEVTLGVVWLVPGNIGTATVTVTARDPSGRTATRDIDVTVLSGPDRDAEVLGRFYDATGGGSWFDRGNWKTGAPTGDWFGVSTEFGRVTGLHLVGNSLTGPLPAALEFLSELTVLTLSANRLTGPIPESLGNLSNLESLSLDSNRLTGPLPATFGQLSNLRYLDLSENELSGPLPLELTRLSRLDHLDIRNTRLCVPPDDAYQAWLAGINRFLGSTCSVTSIDALTALYDATGGPNWTNSRNWNTDAPLEEWYGVSTGGDGGVTVLDLRANGLNGSIPAALAGLSDLEGLDLGENALTGSLPPALGSLPNLRLLDLGKNALSGSIPAALGNLSELITLNLGANQLSGSIPSALSRAAKLELLYLHENALSGSIPDFLSRLSNLERLYLHDNSLSGSIRSSLGRLSNLEQLYLDKNRLTGSVPDSLGDLSNLEELSLAYNPRVSGTLPRGLRRDRLRYLNVLDTQMCGPADWMDWVPNIYFLGELCGAESVTIDVAIVYTQAARDAAGGARTIWMEIDKKIAETNRAFADSGVRHRVRLVARREVDYDETADGNTVVSEFDGVGRVVDGDLALDRLQSEGDGYMDDVHDLRQVTGADIVHLLIANGNGGGHAGRNSPFGLSILGHPGAFPHELGHNMGLRHDRYQTYYHETEDRTISTGPEFGYVNQRMFDDGAPESSRWTTLMAYPTQCTDANEEWSCPRLFRFSNPRQMVGDDPLGVPVVPGVVYDRRGLRGLADAVAVLNAAGPAVAAWMDRAPISFSIPDRGSLSRTSIGAEAAMRSGYGRIGAGAGSSTPSGIAIFGFRQGGVLVAEAGVPASEPLQEGRIFAEVDGNVNTGLAIANPNNTRTTIGFYFTDAGGQRFGEGSFELGAHEQTAKFLDQAPFNSGDEVLGTFTFTSSVPIAVIALRGLTNEDGEFLMTTLPVAPVRPASRASRDTVYFPHFTDGNGWTTQVVLVNPTDTRISGTVEFVGQGSDTMAADPVVVTLDDGRTRSRFSYSIPPRASYRIVTSNPSGGVTSGSVRATPNSRNAAPSGLVVFSFVSGGKTVSEAGVPALPAGSAFRVYAESSGTPNQPGSIRTGLAIANASDTDNNVTLEAMGLGGAMPMGAAPITLPLPPSGQVARFLDEIFDSLPAEFAGVVRVTSTEDVTIVGLRLRYNDRGELKMTTTPPTDETRAPTMADRFFPHIVDSAGWSTQFILFNGAAGQSSSGTLSFFDIDGEPWDLPATPD